MQAKLSSRQPSLKPPVSWTSLNEEKLRNESDSSEDEMLDQPFRGGTPSDKYSCVYHQPWHKKLPWLARVQHPLKKTAIYTGNYKSEVEAAAAVNKTCADINIPLLNPPINTSSSYTAEETKLLRAMVQRYGKKWEMIGKMMNRYPKSVQKQFNNSSPGKPPQTRRMKKVMKRSRRPTEKVEQYRNYLVQQYKKLTYTDEKGLPMSNHSGVTWSKTKRCWEAVLRVKGQIYNLGDFIDQDEAGQAINQKCQELNIRVRNPKAIIQRKTAFEGVVWNGTSWCAQMTVKSMIPGRAAMFECKGFDTDSKAAQAVNAMCDVSGIPPYNPQLQSKPSYVPNKVIKKIKRNKVKPRSEFKGVLFTLNQDGKVWDTIFWNDLQQKFETAGRFANELEAAIAMDKKCDDMGLERQNPKLIHKVRKRMNTNEDLPPNKRMKIACPKGHALVHSHSMPEGLAYKKALCCDICEVTYKRNAVKIMGGVWMCPSSTCSYDICKVCYDRRMNGIDVKEPVKIKRNDVVTVVPLYPGAKPYLLHVLPGVKSPQKQRAVMQCLRKELNPFKCLQSIAKIVSDRCFEKWKGQFALRYGDYVLNWDKSITLIDGPKPSEKSGKLPLLIPDEIASPQHVPPALEVPSFATIPKLDETSEASTKEPVFVKKEKPEVKIVVPERTNKVVDQAKPVDKVKEEPKKDCIELKTCLLLDDPTNPALYTEASFGHVKCVERLLKLKADPKVAGTTGLLPAHIAAQEGHLECLKILLAQYSDPVSRCMTLATESNHYSITQYLRDVFGDPKELAPGDLVQRRGAYGVVKSIAQNGKIEVHFFDGDMMWTTEKKLDRVSSEGLEAYLEKTEKEGFDKTTLDIANEIAAKRKTVAERLKQLKSFTREQGKNVTETQKAIEKTKDAHYKASRYVVELEKQLKTLQAKVEKERENLNKIKTTLERKKVDLENTIKDKEEEIKSLRDGVDTAQAEVDELLKANPDIESQVSDHKLTISRARKFLKHLKKLKARNSSE